VVLVDVGPAAFLGEVAEELRSTDVEVAAGVVDGLRPGEGAEELEAFREAALVLSLQGVVVGGGAVVLNLDGAEGRESDFVGRQAEELLVDVVVASEVLAAITDISNAGGARGSQLALHLQVPLADAGDDVARKDRDQADAGRIGE